MAVQYLRLFDATQQFQLKGGQLNVAGRLYVHLEATDDLAALYDENGVQLSQPVILDNNGRAAGLFVDSAKTYWLDVQDQYGMSQFTIRKMTPCGGGAGSNIHDTEVISTDGSIDVVKTVVGSTTTFDIGIAPSSTEFLEWCKCLNLSISNGLVYPEFAEGSMTTDEGGLHVYKDRFYHITCTLRVDPTGNGINYDTLSATLKYSDGTEVDLVRRNYDIDNSVNDPTLCEFSYDFNCPSDGYLYLYVEGVGYFEQVDVALQVHRVYSGINAVPDTCATQQWVRGYFDYDMSAHIPYSALEYDSNNEIIGISGSAIAGTMNSAQVSAIASSYAESAVSSLSGSISAKLDASASSMFQLSGNFYSASNPSGFISNADLSSFAKESSLSSKLDASASSEFYPTSNPSGFLTAHQSLAGYATESYVDSAVSGKLDVTASSQFLTSLPDDLAYTSDVASAVSGKLDASASSSFYPMTGNPSGFLTAHQSLAGYATVEYVDSSVSGKLDSTSYNSGEFYTTANPSGFVTDSSMSAWIPYSALDYSGTAISGIGGSSLAGIGGGDYSGVAPVSVDNDSRLISVDHRTLCVDDTMTAYNSGSSAVIGVNTAGLDLSSKMDASASSEFYPTSNPSGYITGVDLTPYQLTADMSAYQLSGNYQTAGNYLSSTDSAEFLLTSQSGLFQTSGNYLSATESSNYYSTSNPSGFLTGVDLSDYQKTADMSGFIPTSESSNYQQTGSMTAYQETANMTAYIPVSALGLVEI